MEITEEILKETIEGDICENCGNKWEYKGVCTTCWKVKLKEDEDA